MNILLAVNLKIISTTDDDSVLPRILGRPGGLITQIFDSACTVKKINLLSQAFFFVPRILG